MKKALIGLVAVAFVALMIVNVYAQCECEPPCPPPCECAPGFTPGFWKHNIGVYLGVANGAYSAFEGGPLDGVKCDASVLSTVPYDLAALYETLTTGGGGDIAQARADAANLLNAFFGYGPFVD